MQKVARAKERGLESFSLLFRGLHETALEQNTYTIEHEKLGLFNLFIVPVEKSWYGVDYEAIFSRVRSPER